MPCTSPTSTYLAHIDETATRIGRSAVPQGREPLTADEDLGDATIYRLQTLAESTQRLSPELKASHPEIPGDDIAGFPNRVVHGYLGVNLAIVWDVVERDLPALARMARTELALRRDRAKSRATTWASGSERATKPASTPSAP